MADQVGQEEEENFEEDIFGSEKEEDEGDKAFIDDAGADKGVHDAESDVIRTKGGWTNDDAIDASGDEDDGGKKKRKGYFLAKQEMLKKRRQRKKPVDPLVMDEEVVRFLGEMMRARDDDLRAFRSRKPALNKLKMLSTVETMLRKADYRETLLANSLLPIVKSWLDPMDDGTLPNLEVRSKVLSLLDDFRVGDDWTEHLRNSKGLGRVVHFLSIHDPHPPNARLARRLVDKWSRPIFEAPDDDEEDEQDRDSSRRRRGPIPSNQAALDSARREAKARQHVAKKHSGGGAMLGARIPETIAFGSLKLPPQPDDDGTGQFDRGAARAKEKGNTKTRKLSRMS